METIKAIFLFGLFVGASFVVPYGLKKAKEKIFQKKGNGKGSCCS
jgi:hypothetical protein